MVVFPIITQPMAEIFLRSGLKGIYHYDIWKYDKYIIYYILYAVWIYFLFFYSHFYMCVHCIGACKSQDQAFCGAGPRRRDRGAGGPGASSGEGNYWGNSEGSPMYWLNVGHVYWVVVSNIVYFHPYLGK